MAEKRGPKRQLGHSRGKDNQPAPIDEFTIKRVWGDEHYRLLIGEHRFLSWGGGATISHAFETDEQAREIFENIRTGEIKPGQIDG